MDALTGAVLASGVAWASILAARFVPFERAFGERGLRLLAACSLGVVGLALLGAPLGAGGPWAILALAALALAAAETLRRRRGKLHDPPRGRDAS